MKKQNFLKGSLILMVSAAVVKLFGAIFKIPLTNMLPTLPLNRSKIQKKIYKNGEKQVIIY